MAINIKATEKGQPGVAGGGEKKFYATNMLSGHVDIEELSDKIALISTVSGADTRAVLYALIDVIPSELSDGKSVKLGDIGSFRVSVSSDGVKTADEVNANCVRKSKILFTPGKKLKEMLTKLKYHKM
ncbi:MAG: HU family DNA-binding protein [Marinifilum sp.]|jgi:predicted histone-like DNA-binding protein|nr:HU family DNA-binding protein [Marinifilum sp.]